MRSLIIPFLFCISLIILLPTASALDVFGSPLKYTAGLEPSTHTLTVVNDGESTILLSENLRNICDFNPTILKGSGQFSISCAPTAPIEGYLQVVPPVINGLGIRTGVQIPVVLGDISAQISQTPTNPTGEVQETPDKTPTNPTIEGGTKPIFGLSLFNIVGLCCTVVFLGGGVYYLLWVRRYD